MRQTFNNPDFEYLQFSQLEWLEHLTVKETKIGNLLQLY